jgi:hypothetical protein
MRNFIRLALVAVGGFLAGERLVAAHADWRDWHRWAVADPSAADLYRTNFRLDLAVAAIAIGAAWLVHRFLRWPRDSP